jgi:Ca-activated chloride channel family protein
MAQGIRQPAALAVFLELCAIGPTLPVLADEPVQIVPRHNSLATASAVGTQTVLRVDSSLALIPVHVTTSHGSSVTDLRKENFALFEDGVQQTITHFAQDDAPVSVGLLLDMSGSMKNKMAKVCDAATEIFKFANPDDEFFLVEFNGRAKLKIPFTQDWQEISAEIGRAKPSGLTALLDAIHLAVAQMKDARHTRKAIFILSDGGDNHSRRNLLQLRDALLESDAQVYAMGIFDANYSVKHTPEERNGPRLLNEVALETGGRDFPIHSVSELDSIGVQLARQLRSQYILGYSPTNSAHDGRYRHVSLKLVLPIDSSDLRSYYRRGYYAPMQ